MTDSTDNARGPQAVTVRYTNWRNETTARRLILGDVRYGSTEWHQAPTYLIRAYDLDHPAKIWKDFDLTKCDFTRADLAPEPLADPRVTALEKALSVAMWHLAPMQPGDSRAVDDWFVACAAVQCDLDDSDGKINACLDTALAALEGGKDDD